MAPWTTDRCSFSSFLVSKGKSHQEQYGFRDSAEDIFDLLKGETFFWLNEQVEQSEFDEGVQWKILIKKRYRKKIISKFSICKN